LVWTAMNRAKKARAAAKTTSAAVTD
jgi:hypothetical protein